MVRAKPIKSDQKSSALEPKPFQLAAGVIRISGLRLFSQVAGEVSTDEDRVASPRTNH
jgi:hypothetical protein